MRALNKKIMCTVMEAIGGDPIYTRQSTGKNTFLHQVK